jgi:hypothetical protein
MNDDNVETVSQVVNNTLLYHCREEPSAAAVLVCAFRLCCAHEGLCTPV